MKINTLRSFGRYAGCGDEAQIIHGDDNPPAKRLEFVQSSAVNACAFMNPPVQTGHAFDLDFYYPHARSRLCIHAALAAAYIYLQEHPDLTEFRMGTCFDRQEIIALKRDEYFFLKVQSQPFAFADPDPELLASILGIQISDMVSKPAVCSVGSPKMLVQVFDMETLNSMRPDLERVVRWSAGHGISGCYVYRGLDDGSFAGRNFNHLDPSLEDAATGVAAGALALHLKKSLVLNQGDLIGNPCSIHAVYNGETVEIGGRVERCL